MHHGLLGDYVGHITSGQVLSICTLTVVFAREQEKAHRDRVLVGQPPEPPHP